MFAFDQPISLTLNGFVGQYVLLQKLTFFCADIVPYLLAGIVCFYVLEERRVVRTKVRILCMLVGIAALVRLTIKPLIACTLPFARPYVLLPDITLYGIPQTREALQSFPSAHAMFFFSLATAMHMHDRRLGVVLYIGAAVMSVARVAGGLHYTSDVVCGAIIGSLGAYVLVRVTRRYIPKYFKV